MAPSPREFLPHSLLGPSHASQSTPHRYRPLHPGPRLSAPCPGPSHAPHSTPRRSFPRHSTHTHARTPPLHPGPRMSATCPAGPRPRIPLHSTTLHSTPLRSIPTLHPRPRIFTPRRGPRPRMPLHSAPLRSTPLRSTHTHTTATSLWATHLHSMPRPIQISWNPRPAKNPVVVTSGRARPFLREQQRWRAPVRPPRNLRAHRAEPRENVHAASNWEDREAWGHNGPGWC